MSLSKPDRKMRQSFGSRKSTFILPKEIWIYIWEFLDFETLQKECTLVSKTWLKEIRKTASLSGEMRLKLPKKLVNLTAQNINNVLSRWKKLKVLHVSSRVENDVPSEQAITQFGINLSAHKLLRKIVITKVNSLWDLIHRGF